MPKLTDIFKKLNFSAEKQIAIIQIMMESGCFGEKPTKGNEQDLEAIKKIVIPSEWNEFKKELPTDSPHIQSILNYSFEGISEQELFNYLKSITQLKLLGTQDFIYKTNHQLKTSEFKELTDWQESCMKSLGLFKENQWSATLGKITDVLLHPNINVQTKNSQGILDVRIDALFKNIKQHGAMNINVYYPTSLRALLNNETYLAESLAEGFIQTNHHLKDNYKLIVETINEVLLSSEYNWKNGFSLLKADILAKLKAALKNENIQWPQFSPALAPEYDQEAEFEKKYNNIKREPLANSWPTTEHMLPKLLQEAAKKYDCKNEIKLRVIPALGEVINGKYYIAGTELHLRAFKDYVKKSGTDISTLAVVSDVSHTTGAPRQLLATQHACPEYKCIPINNGAGRLINFNQVKQELAKYLYTLHGIVKMAEKSELVQGSIFAPQSPDVTKESSLKKPNQPEYTTPVSSR